jgi:hypothetical protein
MTQRYLTNFGKNRFLTHWDLFFDFVIKKKHKPIYMIYAFFIFEVTLFKTALHLFCLNPVF